MGFIISGGVEKFPGKPGWAVEWKIPGGLSKAQGAGSWVPPRKKVPWRWRAKGVPPGKGSPRGTELGPG